MNRGGDLLCIYKRDHFVDSWSTHRVFEQLAAFFSAAARPDTPTHASWVNLIECFFSILTRQGLQQAVHQSGKELEHFLKSFIDAYNKRCGPFQWTKGPDKLRRIIELTERWQSQ